MKKRMLIALLVGAMLIVSIVSTGGIASAAVNVNIFPPAFVFPAPPPVFFIPGTYAYFVPDVDIDIFFYHGYWYRPYGGHWFRSNIYNGPWARIAPARVPGVFINLPPNFRAVPPGHQRIPYGQLRKNWRGWERDRYWDREREHERREWKREERREHREGRGRGRY